MKKEPVRRCVGCGEGKTKKDLVRVVRSKDGEISLDSTGKKPGRGAYLCNNQSCLAKAIKRKSLERSFSSAIPDEIYENLKAGLAEDTQDG